jgi:hypothetical protein
MSAELHCDVCVVGGGSGGFGVALAAARAGAGVVLVERQSRLGGTSTQAFISSWEPGPGCSFAREVYEKASRTPGAAAITRRAHRYSRDEPYGLVLPDPQAGYESTLRRAGVAHEDIRSATFQPGTLAGTFARLLRDSGVQLLLNTSFRHADVAEGEVAAVLCADVDGSEVRVRAAVFVDATGGVLLCRAAGCETMLGPEARSRFEEPSAPEEPASFLNGISLCYRIRRSAGTAPRPPKPEADLSPEDVGTVASVCGPSEQELVVNPLRLLPGTALIEKGYDRALAEARRRVPVHWAWLHEYLHFRDYELHDVAPMLGVRESYRAVTDYVLTEHDLRAGVDGQEHEDVVALADHALDVHGGGPPIRELAGPYGIPYRCLLPGGLRNVLVACRGAGFSHIAASSARLSRTVMALGHAAGLAAARAAESGGDVREVDVHKLRRELG